MSWIIYVISLIALACALWQVWLVAYRLELPRLVLVCLAAGLLPYLSSLAPGIVGLYSPVPVGLLLILLCTLLAFCLPSLVSIRPLDSGGAWRIDPTAASRYWFGPWNVPVVATVIASAVLLEPLLRHARRAKTLVTSPAVILPVDVVSYHLPSLVDFVQHKSLWRMTGRYSSYSFGFELLYGYPALFFHSHWGTGCAHLYSIIFLFSSMLLVCNSVGAELNDAAGNGDRGINLPLVAILSFGLWCALFPWSIEAVGKNDIFLSATLLCALGLLMRRGKVPAQPQGGGTRVNVLFWTAAGAAGLAAGTKATGALYVPFFALIASRVSGFMAEADTPLRRAGRALAFAIAAALIGGFWYIRNLCLLGHIVGVEGENFDRSVLAHLLYRRELTVHKGVVITVVACLAPGLLGALLWSCRRPSVPGNVSGPSLPSASLLLLFLVFSLPVYLITPFVVWTNTLWQLRLGMPFFTAAGVALALAGARALAWRGWETPLAPGAVTLGAFALAVALPVRWARTTPSTLPGHDVVRALPRTGVYRWANGLDQPARIYVAGLPAYGFYGRNWQNRLFYDYRSATLFGPEVRPNWSDPLLRALPDRRTKLPVAQSRLLGVLRSFAPDFIIIAVDPGEEWPLEKPLVSWMRGQKCFEEVYSDDTASAFRVKEGWQDLATQFPPARVRFGA
jgi:hypothetical protein